MSPPTGTPADAPPIRRIAILGCGMIGASWAGFYAAQGLTVRLYDLDTAALMHGLRQAQSIAADCIRLTSLPNTPPPAFDLAAASSLAEACADADFMQESVFESYEIKQQAHLSAEAHLPPTAILASSTSGLLVSRMQAPLRRPERLLIAHPFNPPHLIPLVELVPGPATAPACVETCLQFFSRLGKTPVVVRKEVPGHLANRLALAVWREALDLVYRGVATVGDVDKAMAAGPGLRYALMGPHLAYHLGGGAGGYQNFFEHFSAHIRLCYGDMANWTELPADLPAAVLAQMPGYLAGRSRQQIEHWRDQGLAQVLAAVTTAGCLPPAAESTPATVSSAPAGAHA